MASEPISRMLYTSSCSVWSQPLKPHVSQHMRCYIHVVQLSNWRPPNRLWLDSKCLLGDLGSRYSQRPVIVRPATSAAALGGKAEMLGNSRVSTTSISALHTGMSASRMFAALPVAGWMVTVAPVLLTCNQQSPTYYLSYDTSLLPHLLATVPQIQAHMVAIV